MRVTHICLAGPFSDGWNYQENLLTKYNRKNGHNVDVITSCYMWFSNGSFEKRENYMSYIYLYTCEACI